MAEEHSERNVDENENLNQSIRRNAKMDAANKFTRLRRTNRGLKIAVTVLATVIIILFLIVILRRNGSHSFNICTTTACKETAKRLFSNLDVSVDPCEDFYNFSCGGWIKNNPRPANENMWSVHTDLSLDLNKKLIATLEDFHTFRISAVRKAQNFFAACNNLDYRDEYSVDDIRLLLRKIGGFPLLQKSWKGEGYDWQKAYIYLDTRLDSIQPIFEYDFGATLAKTSVIKLHSPYKFDFGIATQYKGTEEDRKNNETFFKQKITQKIKVLLSDLSDDEIEKDVIDIIRFDEQLTKLAVDGIKASNQYIKFTFAELQTNVTKINWLRIFNEIFSLVDVKLEDNEPIFVQNSHHYFKHIGDLLETTPKRTIANYFGWKVVNEFGTKVLLQLIKVDKGNVTKEQIKKLCFDSTEENFVIPVNHMFVQKEYGNSSLTELKSFLNQLKSSLTLTLQNNHWMDDGTKLQAQLKLNKMLDYIASPSWIANDSDVDQLYENTGSFSSENYYSALKRISKWKKEVLLSTLRIEKKPGLIIKPSVVNAYYRPTENKIYILTSVLQPPYYYKDAPLAVNFGGIGSVIGHEITHGFDIYGSRYDHTGQPRNWWANETLQLFKEKVKCFVNQYNNYTEPLTGKQVNGEFTIKDNIADNGGVQQSFEAYKIYSAVKHPEKDLRLPLSMSRFTTDQLYFIAYANTFCASFKRDFAEKMLTLDEHAPFSSRVIIPLSNSKEFSKAFKCKAGSRMNPEEKCKIW